MNAINLIVQKVDATGNTTAILENVVTYIQKMHQILFQYLKTKI